MLATLHRSSLWWRMIRFSLRFMGSFSMLMAGLKIWTSRIIDMRNSSKKAQFLEKSTWRISTSCTSTCHSTRLLENKKLQFWSKKLAMKMKMKKHISQLCLSNSKMTTQWEIYRSKSFYNWVRKSNTQNLKKLTLKQLDLRNFARKLDGQISYLSKSICPNSLIKRNRPLS